MKIFWSDTSLTQLHLIFDFYNFAAGEQVANKIVKGIVEKSILLKSYPFLGLQETLLASKPYEYRYIVGNNYKIVYRIDDNIVLIVSVFDCRQNPQKIGEFAD